MNTGGPSFLEPGAEAPSIDEARVVVLPIPYEATVSWGRGTSRGPRAVLEASAQLELFDEQSGSVPSACGVWTEPELPVAGGEPEAALLHVQTRCGQLLDDGKWPLLLGGEHSITVGAVRAAAERHPGLEVVQLDAHADLRDTYQGSRWSHACVAARCTEIAPLRAIGVRSYSAEEGRRIRQGIPGYRITHAWEMEREGWIELALEGLSQRPVYLSVDVDYFDPAIVPATGTPEPGGGRWWPTLALLKELFRTARVVAADLVELAPIPGLHHADYAVARLAHKLIGYACDAAFGKRVS